MLSSILSVNVARADELTAAAISDSTIYGTWTGSGGSGTATANGQTIPITMSYVGVEILYPETYAVGNKNVTLRSLVVNANTGEALHESTGTATLTRSQLLIAATRGRSPIRQSARDLP